MTKYCNNCKNEIDDECKTCPNCGFVFNNVYKGLKGDNYLLIVSLFISIFLVFYSIIVCFELFNVNIPVSLTKTVAFLLVVPNGILSIVGIAISGKYANKHILEGVVSLLLVGLAFILCVATVGRGNSNLCDDCKMNKTIIVTDR
jgi:hypothetical protein